MKLTSADFNEVWAERAMAGANDDIEGLEYGQVYAAWVDTGRPAEIEAFIISQIGNDPHTEVAA